MSKGPWAQSAIDHLLRKAVPGPYHVVRDGWGEVHISGAPDRVVCNAETIELAVLGLERFRADAERDQTVEDELEELKESFDELESGSRETEKVLGEVREELSDAKHQIEKLKSQLRIDDTPHHQ